MVRISGATAAGSAAGVRALHADVASLRANVVALLAKLDADSGVDDEDYAATLTPAALTSEV